MAQMIKGFHLVKLRKGFKANLLEEGPFDFVVVDGCECICLFKFSFFLYNDLCSNDLVTSFIFDN